MHGIQKVDIEVQPKPFVKWAGGKRSIIKELLQRVPQKIKNYYEPFVGGGALFFELYASVAHSYLSDRNVELIITYLTIKNNPVELIKRLQTHKENHSEAYYYHMRSLQELSDPVENSARFIYLMRTCFNGLYRVNKNNAFNTPMGRYKNPNICDVENIGAVNEALKYASIRYQDFTKITPEKGDFVYFDPPYHPTNGDSFTKYVSNGFTDKDQVRLRDFALELQRNGVNVMISNADTDFIETLYSKDFTIEKVWAPRIINAKGTERQPVYEVVIKGF